MRSLIFLGLMTLLPPAVAADCFLSCQRQYHQCEHLCYLHGGTRRCLDRCQRQLDRCQRECGPSPARFRLWASAVASNRSKPAVSTPTSASSGAATSVR